MAYFRVIPRDMFNEANLLKCLGHLWLSLERSRSNAEFTVEAVEFFEIEQDSSDGSIEVVNVPFLVNGRPARLYRPLNSRQPWPLWVDLSYSSDFKPIQVFDQNGCLSDDFKKLIRKEE